MAQIKRSAQARWEGSLRAGMGQINSESGAIKKQPYSFSTRFEDEPGTNPEELLAAAHAACFSMAFSLTLTEKGHKPEAIETHATCILASQPEGGFKITEMHLSVQGVVPGIDAATFREIAEEADKGCPVSNLLRPGLKIKLTDVTLK
ncbi:MAG: OsmC family protein [Anaerolineae bacterium]|nr:OsmC family protein [Anaerolineae bacterium]